MEIGQGIRWPSPLLKEAWDEGTLYPTGVTEPWTQQVVADLLVASGQSVVLELGTYLGFTTLWLALALDAAERDSRLLTVELDRSRCNAAYARLAPIPLKHVNVTFAQDEACHAINALPDASVGFAWVDDDHSPAHVDEELTLLRPKMREGGLITMHDVSGPLGLDAVCRAHGGHVLHFPRLGAAGGLGVIQC